MEWYDSAKCKKEIECTMCHRYWWSCKGRKEAEVKAKNSNLYENNRRVYVVAK